MSTCDVCLFFSGLIMSMRFSQTFDTPARRLYGLCCIRILGRLGQSRWKGSVPSWCFGFGPLNWSWCYLNTTTSYYVEPWKTENWSDFIVIVFICGFRQFNPPKCVRPLWFLVHATFKLQSSMLVVSTKIRAVFNATRWVYAHISHLCKLLWTCLCF